MSDRYGRDVLAADPHAPRRTRVEELPAEAGLVVECADTGWCGEVVGTTKTTEGWAVVLEDRHGVRRPFMMRPAAFLLEGRTVTLVRPTGAATAAGPARTASGSIAVADLRARVARGSRIWVEGLHDAELVEKVWGHDLRVEGVVVEPLHGADDLLDLVRDFAPGPGRRIGVLLDHLVPGSKETRIAEAVRQAYGAHVTVLGHPYAGAGHRGVARGAEGAAVEAGRARRSRPPAQHPRRRRRGVALAARSRAQLRRPRAEPARPRRGAHRHRHHLRSSMKGPQAP
jgi:hypothetical protein